MANISFFYPDRMKGWALGLNAAGGNIGVTSVQLLTPILMGLGLINLYQATPVGGVYPAERRPDVGAADRDRGVRRGVLHEQPHLGASRRSRTSSPIVKRKHTWIMSFIYIGTFGSFIGYSAAFPLLIKTQFPAVTIAIAFLGPLVGSLSRPLGGLLADKIGGAIVTFWNFIAMARRDGRRPLLRRDQGLHRLPGDVPDPVRHHRHRQRLDLPDDPVDLPRGESAQGEGQGRSRPGAALKTAEHRERRRARLHRRDRRLRRLSDPERLRQVDRADRRPAARADDLPRFYAVCLALTWWFYLRRSPADAGAPSLAEARV